MLSSENLREIHVPLNNSDTFNKFNAKGSAELTSIESRFGEVLVDYSKALFFPKGLYGFPENLHFALATFPGDAAPLEGFKILQCLNDHTVSIPVLPAAFENSFIDAADMEQCLDSVEVKKDNFAMLFIVSSKKNISDDTFSLTINTKAPIVMDVNLQTAIQYIFTNNKYSTSANIK